METKIKKGFKKNIKNLYSHLGVQSILDLKALTGRVDIEDLYDMFRKSEGVYSLFYGDFVCSMFFFVRGKNNKYNLFVFSTDLPVVGIKDKLKNFIPDNTDALVYNNNKKVLKLLKSCGFIEKGMLKYGVEKKNFRLLRR